MPKKTILFIVCAIFFSGFNLARADVVINEIMYAPEGSDVGREWIEVYNDSDAPLDLSLYKFFEDNTNHKLVVSQGDVNIEDHGYAVIVSDPVKFKIDWPNFSGSIFDSSFSLSDTGEDLAIKDESSNIINTVTYNFSEGAKEDGNSLQLVNGSWVGATPTPGVENESSASSNVEDTSNNSNANDNNTNEKGTAISSSSSSSNSSNQKSTTTTKTIIVQKIKAEIIAKSSAHVGIPFLFQGIVLGLDGEQVHRGKYFWNFGDGDFREIKVMNADEFSHTYFYPGDYMVIFEYYKDFYNNSPDASQKILIKVVPADVVISSVGDEKDFFIELSNNTNYEADLSNWILSSYGKSFTIPKNTIIGSKKKIIISPKITNFSVSDKNSLQLMTPMHELVFNYSSRTVPALASVSYKNAKGNINQPTNKIIESESAVIKNETMGLSSNVLSSGVLKENKQSYVSVIILILLLGASGGIVYFLRQKKIILNNGKDFEILDE